MSFFYKKVLDFKEIRGYIVGEKIRENVTKKFV